LERPRKRLDLADDATYAHCRGEVLRFLYARHRPADADAA
jgi:nitrate/nitrite transport system ATP-binding protein